jgi:anhydro-N-acetylmuramic acid kinase
MSGTSLDSIDAALVSFDKNHCTIIDTLEYNISNELRIELMGLCLPSDNEIERLGEADRQLGKAFADAATTLLHNNQIKPQAITAIGSHGQTIRHRPQANSPFTLQIGDPNTIAFNTGITTVADFRRKDIAAGGQGAPLAPAFHRATFGSKQYNRAIINIGGMANITYLNTDGQHLGFDTGPGNILLDSWIQKTQQKKYDTKGQWASSGKVINPLLDSFLSDPYFAKPIPKSTGREDFNLDFIEKKINNNNYAAQDIQATLLELTTQTIIQALSQLPEPVDEIYICGGGAYNTQLMQRLETLAQPARVASTQLLGIAPEWVEAAAFAWLAKQTLERKSGNLIDVTGAERETILGGIYLA